MSDTCVPSVIVIDTAINQLEIKVSLKTICCLRLFVVVYKPLHTGVFIKAVRYYVYKLSFTKLLYFLSYMDTCIAIIMYCQRLFLLLTFFFRGTYLQRISVFLQNFKVGGVTVLAIQLFNKIK